MYHFMEFDPTKYGPKVSRILADGKWAAARGRWFAGCALGKARGSWPQKPADLFPGLRDLGAAMGGVVAILFLF
jgi:hypothetical protein